MVKKSETAVEVTPKAVHVKVFCATLGISEALFWKYAHYDLIRHFRIGERVLVWASEIERLMHEGLPTVPQPPKKDKGAEGAAGKKAAGARGARAMKRKAKDAETETEAA
jgi:hypothetical protein